MSYVGAKSDAAGRGYLGFGQMTTTDLQANLIQAATFRQDFPYIVVSTPDGFSKTTTNTYTNNTINWHLGRLTGASVTGTTPP